MLKITGLDNLQNQLNAVQQALRTLEGQLATVSFDPHDPSSIEVAIQTAYKMVDDRAGSYTSHPLVGSLVEQMKAACRENILQKATDARLQSKESDE